MKQLLGVFLIGVLLVGLVNIPQAESVSCVACKIKVVITFEHSASLTQIKNALDTEVRPGLVSGFQTFITDHNFIVTNSWLEPTDTSVNIIGFNETSGNNVYQYYPKAVISASNDQTSSEFNLAWDVFIAETRQRAMNYFSINGAEEVSTYLHYSWGSARFNEGF